MKAHVLILLILFYLTPTARADSFFISSSHGNDLNDGLSETTPWKTLSRLHSATLKGGDLVRLRRGDVWKGEFFKARRADDSGWVRIEPYGEGNKPKVWPGYEHPAAIQIGDSERDGQGGWIIKNLDIGYVQAGILFYNENSQPRGLKIEDCDVHDIHGANMFQYNYMHHSTGIVLYNPGRALGKSLSDVWITGTSITRADAPLSIRGVNNLSMDRVRSSYTNRGGISLFEVTNGVMENSVIEWAGIHGMFWGTAGLELSKCERVLIRDTEIAYTQKPAGSPDGVGLDIEGSNVDVTALRLNVHHNQGSAFLVYRNPDWGVDNIRTNILDCTVSYNGLEHPQQIPAFLRHYHNAASGGKITGNKILRLHPNQPINLVDGIATDKWPQSYEIGTNPIETQRVVKKRD